ncbi:hypothetical protein GYMLUDRAFT_257413 [Collybiopsis luxurians FD-317 M1]|nr:hypothetical protein GYMLUDRAFT_257413 [Collybiopsis luxurians FD-317 M1]
MLAFIRHQLNFYRVHVLFFTLTPLIFSGIFYASNGEFKISYIDALFNCVSAMTVCGLTTIDLSSLTPWQQVILFIQMCLGSPVLVSWVVVYIRRYYFDKKFQNIIEAEAVNQKIIVPNDRSGFVIRWVRSVVSLLKGQKSEGLPITSRDSTVSSEKERNRKNPKKFRTDMIRRMDEAPKLVNPSGWISEGDRIPVRGTGTTNSHSQSPPHDASSPGTSTERKGIMSRRLSDPGTPSRPVSPQAPSTSMRRFDTAAPRGPKFARAPTVEFSASLPRRRARMDTLRGNNDPTRPNAEPLQPDDRRSIRRLSVSHGPPLAPTYTYNTYKSNRGTKHSGFGGFPMPHEIIQKLFEKFFPQFRRKITRTITIPATTTIASQRGDNFPPGAKIVPYISFEAVVGRNSAFPLLTDEQLEELGGVEYRALNALLWIVAGYHIGVQLLSFIVISAYMSTSRWKDNFLPPALYRPVSSTWFSLYQTTSAYTNTGSSLVDTSMVPFQKAYPMIVFMMILILAGNTAFPIFLRALIFGLSKVVSRRSRLNETLQFLLDHPRRCFMYLFPSHQTWFLLTVVVMLNATDWFFFMVLDIGTPAIEAIPLGVRFLAGLLQATAVRAAGFGIVAIAALAPAVKVLYVVMMYISVYPIAMSVRSTNVYEEQSLGIYRDVDLNDEQDFQFTGSRMTVWSKYLAMHARKQLSFDMWWLGLALFLVCIIERAHLDDTNTATWFNIFNIVFELTSAYGTVGLSVGLPNQNYSFSGAFRPLSKLIVIAVMLRGRHRGLPVAIDRAVMLPSEYQRHDEIDAEVASQYINRRGSRTFQEGEGFTDSQNFRTSHVFQGSDGYADNQTQGDEDRQLSVLPESRQEENTTIQYIS